MRQTTVFEIIGVIGVAQDITNEEKVRREQERTAIELALLIDTANAPIFGTDDKGKITEWNRKTSELTGFTKEEVMGKNLVADYINTEYKVAVADVLKKALQGSETANYTLPLRK